ncbi:hypothetical protein MOKP125_52330 [Mycobacterium avium subsp. hominissuis]
MIGEFLVTDPFQERQDPFKTLIRLILWIREVVSEVRRGV